MKSLMAIGLVLMAFAPAAAVQQPRVDKGDLTEFFVGKWTVKGQERTFHEECRLLTRNSFVICEGKDANPKDPISWISLRGYSHFDDLYNFAEYGSDGSVYQYSGWLNDGVWTFLAHRQYEQRVVRIEDTITPTPAGYFQTRRISINGADWETRFKEEHIRIAD
mgnify:CR=1 FL=1